MSFSISYSLRLSPFVRWKGISKLLVGRTDYDVAVRWRSLDLKLKKKKRDWTQEEDDLIWKQQKLLGNR